jgi:hypothetical protein
MDSRQCIALHFPQQRVIPQQERLVMAETYTVVWSGTKEKQEHDAQVRPAPELPEAQGSTGKTWRRMDGPRRSDEDGAVIDLRNRWQIPNRA